VRLENVKREIKHTVEIASQAVANSAAEGRTFDMRRQFAHDFDPDAGSARLTWSGVRVIAQTATMAEALSIAFSMLPAEIIRRIASRFDGVDSYVSGQGDRIRAL